MTPCSPNPQSLTGSEYKKSKVGFPIRKSSDQSLFAAPQGLSQRTTSFIASQRQGIHRMLLLHLITLMIDGRLSLSRDVDPYNDRPQDSAPRQRSERPVFGTLIPKTFACLMHPAHTPCGGRVAPRSKIPEPATCITSLRCQTPAIAPLCEEPPRIAKISTEHSSLNPTGETTHTPHAQNSQEEWWSQTGSNRRPEACKATALPTELWPPWVFGLKRRQGRPSLWLSRASARAPVRACGPDGPWVQPS